MHKIPRGFIAPIALALAAVALGTALFFGTRPQTLEPTPDPVLGATCTGTNFGGTGVCYPTTVSYGNILVGNVSGGYTLTATSSLGISGGGSQNLAGVLTQGNDGGGLNIADVGTISGTIIQATSTTNTPSNIANFGGTLDPALFSGANIGAKLNTGYTGGACSTKGCGFFLSQPSSGTEWSYNTPIAFTTSFHPVLLHCASGGGGTAFSLGGGTVLNYTGSTGSAVSFNTNNYIVGGTGIENCDIHGPSGSTNASTIGVSEGGAEGSFATRLKDVTVSGFGVGVDLNSNTSFNSIDGAALNFNGINFRELDTSGANCENIRITNSVLADAENQTGGAIDKNGLYIQESGNCQFNAGFDSFDDNQLNFNQFGGTANVNTIVATHQENPNLDVYPMLITNVGSTNVVTNLIGGDMMNDTVAGQPDQIEAAGQVNLIGFTSDANNNVGTPVTRIISALASSTIITWDGLACKGANATSFVYGNVPCSPFGVGSDYGAPAFMITYPTGTTQLGRVGVGTSTPSTNLTVAASGVNGILLDKATDNNLNSSRLMFDSLGGTPMMKALGGDLQFFTGGTVNVSTGVERMRLTLAGNFGIGTTTPVANFQVATTTANATTTVEIGKANQTAGSCLKLYRTDGSAIYAYILAGTTTFTLSTTACATATGF